jgi:hypothetical protein
MPDTRTPPRPALRPPVTEAEARERALRWLARLLCQGERTRQAAARRGVPR